VDYARPDKQPVIAVVRNKKLLPPAVPPQKNREAGTTKDKAVRLMGVFMWSSNHAQISHGQITHANIRVACHLIVAKKLDEMPSPIIVLRQAIQSPELLALRAIADILELLMSHSVSRNRLGRRGHRLRHCCEGKI
jgi:hypothetical protein